MFSRFAEQSRCTIGGRSRSAARLPLPRRVHSSGWSPRLSRRPHTVPGRSPGPAPTLRRRRERCVLQVQDPYHHQAQQGRSLAFAGDPSCQRNQHARTSANRHKHPGSGPRCRSGCCTATLHACSEISTRGTASTRPPTSTRQLTRCPISCVKATCGRSAPRPGPLRPPFLGRPNSQNCRPTRCICLTGVPSHTHPAVHTVALLDVDGKPLRLLLNPQRRQAGAESVILQRGWRAEHRHDAVSCTLIERCLKLVSFFERH